MHLSDDPDDADDWLVLCPTCLRLWPCELSGSDQQATPLASQALP